MWLLFIPILIMLALVLSLGAIVAGLFWVLSTGWPLLLIGLGLWLFLHGDRRPARRDRCGSDLRRLHVQPAASRSSTRQPRDKRSSVTNAADPLGAPELPVEVQVKVEQIRRKVDVLLSYAGRFPPFSHDLYLVRQTASEYLPRTIGAYLALPKQVATQTPLSMDGNTAYQELKAQLELLDGKLDDIATDLQRQDTDRLLANRRFLEARFGTREAKTPGAA
ncbi:MAG: hypothetical protein ACR2IK_19360 [Chloroflexota bacterium]